MAQVVDVGKLRQVLDYWSCETCLDSFTPEQEYFCAVCVRTNRDVRVKPNAVGTDEAVQVIPAEDFTMAKDLRDRIQAKELELQEAQERAAALQRRETELMARLEELQQQLENAKTKKDDELVDFSLIGVKREPKPEKLLEFSEEEPAPPAEPAAPEGGWEIVDEEKQPDEAAPELVEPLEPVPEEEPLAEQEPTMAEREPATMTPGRRRQGAAADDAIARIEAEISKIEQELTQLADKEKGLAKSASSGSKPRRRRRN